MSKKKLAYTPTTDAGGVIVRKHNGHIEVLLFQDQEYDDWKLPKGHAEPNETLEQTAQREILEEVGVTNVYLHGLLDTLDLNELGIKHKFKDEVTRYNRFRKIALGKSKEKESGETFDMKAYAVYLLTEGSIAEKRELLANLKSRLTMKNKVLALEK